MVKGVLLLFSVMFTIGCSKGSGGGGGVKGVNVNPNGFKASGPATKGDLPERFSTGCVTPGSNTPNFTIDSRLRVGHQFSLGMSDSDEAGYMAASAIQRITAISADSISSNYQVTSKVNVPIPSDNFNEICRRTSDGRGGYNWECDERRMLSSLNKAKPLANEGCTIHADSADDWEESILPGTYMGRKAYFKTYMIRGEIKCNDDTVNLGMGSMVMNTVYSNQVPATDIYYCGGTSLFYGSEMKLDSGKVISTGMLSYTNAPTVAE